MTKSNRLYNDLAWTFPIISKKEDYIEEGEFYTAKIREHSRIKTNTLLNLGSGAGNLDVVPRLVGHGEGYRLPRDRVTVPVRYHEVILAAGDAGPVPSLFH